MILIVDDNKKYVDRLIDMLAEITDTSIINVAHNYDDAVEKIAVEKPSVVLLDMNMPGKSGFEVLRYIKNERWDCKIIMVTNHSNDSYRRLCKDAGADHFLDKSKEFDLIPSLVERMIA